MWQAVDWERPWLAPYRANGPCVAQHVLQGGTVAQALNQQRDRALPHPPRLAAGALNFVPQQALPDGEAYEAFIARTACVPTRDKLHDAFNGLVWLRFPALKRRLNELQAQQIQRAGPGEGRGPVRDALTLFDENAALLQAPDLLMQALAQRDWQALFVTHRAMWADVHLVLFGHALLEKLTQPRKAITAHVWRVPHGVDAQDWLVNHLDASLLATKPWCPLPVLGVPGWWAGNEDPVFYDDAAVFRPKTFLAQRGAATR